MQTQQKLDSEELLHLAIRATEAERNDDAIGLLKQALEQEPKSGRIHYMLGAVHAQIGMYDRAAEEIAKAVELEPQLHAARFQLGLLHITSGRVAEAEAAWAGLDALGAEHPFVLFKSGMLHLARDEFQACIDDLENGMRANNMNEPLNRDMQQVVDAARAALNGGPEGAPTAGEGGSGASAGRHILLSAYGKGEEGEND